MTAPRQAPTLALFDLDHTLIPFDSGMAWVRFLVGRGVLGPEAEAAYLAFAHRYLDGTLDIRAMHRAVLAPLLGHPRARLDAWAHEYQAEMAERIPPEMRMLVACHRKAGHLLAIVTATTRLVAGVYGPLFGVPAVLCSETQADGDRYTGEIEGEPCYRELKLDHVRRWLAGQGLALDSVARSYFYSDSSGDLALLQAVSDPVAVRPDAALRREAERRGWTILDEPAGAGVS